jgi:hypothetical protein
MPDIQRNSYKSSVRCPVCGSCRIGSARGFGPGAIPAMRAFYACGYTVTAAETSSGRVLVVGIGCRGRKAVASDQ